MYEQQLFGTGRTIRVFNLTPHKVELYLDSGPGEYLSIPSDGSLRADQLVSELHGPRAAFPWGWVVTSAYGSPSLAGYDLALRPGDALIVSTLAADAWEANDWEGLPENIQVYVPDSGSTAARDAQGRITTVCRMIGRKVLDRDQWTKVAMHREPESAQRAPGSEVFPPSAEG